MKTKPLIIIILPFLLSADCTKEAEEKMDSAKHYYELSKTFDDKKLKRFWRDRGDLDKAEALFIKKSCEEDLNDSGQ